MGEARKKKDLEWMIALCEPTPSQEQSLLHCPFARDSEIFSDSILMSSLGPTQPDPNHILMLSTKQPTTPDVFVTPPENQFRSSSDSDQRKRVRLSDDEADSKKIRTEQQHTQPLLDDETLNLADHSMQQPSKDRTFNGCLDISNTEIVVDLGDKVASAVGKSVDAVNVGSGSKNIDEDNVCVVGKEKVSVDAVNVGSGSKNIDEDDVCVVEKVVENESVHKDGVNVDVGAGTSRNGFDEIDKFVYNGNGDANEKQGRRKLPASMRGDDEGNDVGEKEIDFYDILKMLDTVVGDGDGEEVDFVETVKKRGIVFPRPRWWHPDW